MAILKNKTQGSFTMISNKVFRDKTLSMKEIGLLSKLISLPDNWDFSINGIESSLADGESAISNCLRRLEKKGYVRWNRFRGQDGRFKTELEIIVDLDMAITSECSKLDKPVGKIQSGLSGMDKSGQYNTKHHKQNTKDSDKKTIIPSISAAKVENVDRREIDGQNEGMTDRCFDWIAYTRKHVEYDRLCAILDAEEMEHVDRMIPIIARELGKVEKGSIKVKGKYINGREACSHLIFYRFEELFNVAKNMKACGAPANKPDSYYFTALDKQLAIDKPEASISLKYSEYEDNVGEVDV